MEKKSPSSRANIQIYGTVQGVGFRFFVNRFASAAGLTGWVKNNDGFLEAVFEGEKGKIEEVIEAFRKGPPFSKVEKIDLKWEEPTGEFTHFEVM